MILYVSLHLLHFTLFLLHLSGDRREYPTPKLVCLPSAASGAESVLVGDGSMATPGEAVGGGVDAGGGEQPLRGVQAVTCGGYHTIATVLADADGGG